MSHAPAAFAALAAFVLGPRPAPAPPEAVPAIIDSGPVATEEAISLPSHNDWTLRGMRTLPPGNGPRAPAVVLIHGSGPIDMDETMPGSITATGEPSALFKDISDALTSAGFVVLRYHKRGVLGWDPVQQRAELDNEVYAANTVEDLVRDAAAAVRSLRQEPGSEDRPVLLLGHSEGTLIAPLVARQERVDGIILLSAMANRLDHLVHYQLVTRVLGWVKALVDEDRDGFMTRDEASRHPDFHLPFDDGDTDGDGRLSMAEIEASLESRFRSVHAQWSGLPWYRSHLQLEPNRDILPGFQGPILVVQGEEDSQTPLSEALLLEKALRDSGNRDHSMKSFPGIGHGFSPPRNGWEPTVGPIEPYVLDWIVRWAAGRWINRSP